MLFRAIAYMPGVDTPDTFVFFEATDADSAMQTLQRLLHVTWRGECEFYNVTSEAELLRYSQGAPIDGDMRLFEAGYFKGPLYALPSRVQLLTGPREFQRLHAALQRLPAQPEALGAPPERRVGLDMIQLGGRGA